MTKRPLILASLVASLFLAGAAHAQVVKGIDGRWEGPAVLTNGMKLTTVFRVTTKDGKTTTVFDSPEQGAKDVAATVRSEGDKIVFEVPKGGLVYTAKLSADGKTLTGDMKQGPGSIPVTMTQKPAPASTAVTGPAVAGVDGRWEGSLDTGGGVLPLVLRVSTAAGKTTTLLDSPAQGATGIPAITKREGQKVTVEVAAVAGSFTGNLSADGKTVAGTWNQGGNSLSLTLAKK